MAGTDAHHVRIAEQDSPTIDPHNDTEDAAGVHQADEAESSLPVSVGTGQKKKKKKKKSGKKSRLKKGSNQPTGFEEYYVDPPMTPAEHAVEVDLYDPSKDFQERIEIAVSRFESRRKFGDWQRELFDKYLAFGGFDSGPKPFSTFDANEKEAEGEDMSAADVARLKNTTYVSKWVLENKGEVDFDGVLKAFLSNYLSRLFMLHSEQEIRSRINVLRSFFNYLLYHNVCPEYTDQVNAARYTCNKADKELWASLSCARKLPGGFNTACSVIFGGYYHITDDENFEPDPRIPFGMPRQTALKVFQGGMAANSTVDMFNKYQRQGIGSSHKRIRSVQTSLEVTCVDFSSYEVQSFYQEAAMAGLEPTGKLTCKTWYSPYAQDEDLTEEEEAELNSKGQPIYTYEFWVEDSVLAEVFVGMLMDCEVYETSFGLHYFDAITATMVSFHTHIPNIDMEGYKEPRELEPRDKYEQPELHAYIPERGRSVPGAGIEEGDDEDDDPALAKYEKGEDINITV